MRLAESWLHSVTSLAPFTVPQPQLTCGGGRRSRAARYGAGLVAEFIDRFHRPEDWARTGRPIVSGIDSDGIRFAYSMLIKFASARFLVGARIARGCNERIGHTMRPFSGPGNKWPVLWSREQQEKPNYIWERACKQDANKPLTSANERANRRRKLLPLVPVAAALASRNLMDAHESRSSASIRASSRRHQAQALARRLETWSGEII